MPDQPPLEPFVPGPLDALKPVLSEPVPTRLFACNASVRGMSRRHHGEFDAGAELTEEMSARYTAHLSYCHGLGEKFYEAGPSADFTEMLYIYRVENLEEARDLMTRFTWTAACRAHGSSSASCSSRSSRASCRGHPSRPWR